MKENPQSIELHDNQVGEVRDLILHNDDVNTFDFVIDALIEVCRHDPEQAEQCAWIAHYKGKCPVKQGEFDFLRSLRGELLDRGLIATIE